MSSPYPTEGDTSDDDAMVIDEGTADDGNEECLIQIENPRTVDSASRSRSASGDGVVVANQIQSVDPVPGPLNNIQQVDDEPETESAPLQELTPNGGLRIAQVDHEPQMIAPPSSDEDNDLRPAMGGARGATMVRDLQQQIETMNNVIRSKDQLLTRLARDNKENVNKAQEHIFKMQRTFTEKTQAYGAEILALKENLKQARAVIGAKDSLIQTLKQAITQAKNEIRNRPPTPSQPQMKQDIEVISPSNERFARNGVFILREGTKAELCIRLPLKVSLEGCTMKIADTDVAAAGRKSIERRREILVQTVDLLFNPLNTSMTVSRCQHLVWILLATLFEKYHFKDPKDKYLLGTQDTISLNSSLVIKTKRKDCLAASATWNEIIPGESNKLPHQIKVREIEIKRHLRTIDKVNAQKRKLEDENNEKKPIISAKKWKSCGPKSKTAVSDKDMVKDATMEERMIKAACANSRDRNLDCLKTFITENIEKLTVFEFEGIPNIFDPEAKGIVIAFVPTTVACDRDKVETGTVFMPVLLDPDIKPTIKYGQHELRSIGFKGLWKGQLHDKTGTPLYISDSEHPVSEFLAQKHLEKVHGSRTPFLSVMKADEPLLGTEAQLALIEDGPKEQKKASFSDKFPRKVWVLSVDKELETFLNQMENGSGLSFSPYPKEEHEIKIKEEPMDTDQPPVFKIEPVFKCRYGPKVFTIIKAWDAHLEARYGHCLPFLCPMNKCHKAFATKLALLVHINYFCIEETRQRLLAAKKNDELKIVQENPKVMEKKPPVPAPAPTVVKPAVAAETTPKLIIKKSKKKKKPAKVSPKVTSDSDPGSRPPEQIKDLGERRIRDPREGWARGLKRLLLKGHKLPEYRRFVSHRAPCVESYITHNLEEDTPNDSEDLPPPLRATEEAMSAIPAKIKIEIKQEPEEAMPTPTPTPPVTPTTSKRSRATPSSAAAQSMPSPARPDYSNKISRRAKHPQVSFTASLKDLIVTVAAWMKTRKVLIKKETGKSVTWSPQLFRKIEDQIDGDGYSERKSLMRDLNEFCAHVRDKALAEAQGAVRDKVTPENQKLFGDELESYIGVEFEWRKEYLSNLERAINPLLSDDPQVAFQHVLRKVVEDVNTLRSSHIFQKRVDKRAFPDYYDKITEPICINDIAEKVSKGSYSNKADFIKDFAQIHKNSVEYNGRRSEYSAKALEILNAVKKDLKEHKDFVID